MQRHALFLLLLAACSSSPAEVEGTSDDELHFCRDDSALLPDRTRGVSPLLGSNDVEIAASLPFPPGNVAVSAQGTIFVSMFPDTNYGDTKVGRIDGSGALVPFPDARAQAKFVTVLGIRMDRLGRLWVLDHGKMGLHRPKLWAFDAQSGAVLHEISFSHGVAPFGSMLNDVQIAPDGKTLYISDASFVAGRPAIVVVDLPSGSARRVLERHSSVVRGKYDVAVAGKRVRLAGLCVDGGVDGIALDGTGTWLYYAPLNAGVVYRVPTSALRDPKAEPSKQVERWADATMTDGMISDLSDNVYLTDMEHSAVVRVAQDRSVAVVAKDSRFRWPDGMSWGADGNLYLTASALHQTMTKVVRTERDVRAGGPYAVFRLLTKGGVVGQ